MHIGYNWRNKKDIIFHYRENNVLFRDKQCYNEDNGNLS